MAAVTRRPPIRMHDRCQVVIASGDPEMANGLRDTLPAEMGVEILYRRGLSKALDVFGDLPTKDGMVRILVATVDELAGAPATTRQRLENMHARPGLTVIGGRATGCALPAFIRPMIDDVLPYPFAADELAIRLRYLLEYRMASAKAALADSLLRDIAEAVIITDTADHIVFVNEAFEALTGYACDEVVGRTPDFMRAEQNHETLITQLRASVRDTGSWKGELRNRRKNGEVYAEWLSISVLRDEPGNVVRYISILTDISERKMREENLQARAFHDVLTGLPNRFLLEDRFARVLASAQRSGRTLALCFIDLDGFKSVNDRLGHAVGDHLLQVVAGRLADSVRSIDTVCRYGGDEFVCLLGELSSDDEALAIAGKLLQSVSRDVEIGEHVLAAGASIGIAVAPTHGNALAELIGKADAAMYRAKRAGGNRFEICLPEESTQ